jgi:hypothetical protein
MAKKSATKSDRQSWLDEATQTPLIEEYARQLGSFLEAVADGRINRKELDDQEKRLVALMKKVEPKLDDELHGEVTKLMCELTAYNLMQVLHTLQGSRPATTFQG